MALLMFFFGPATTFADNFKLPALGSVSLRPYFPTSPGFCWASRPDGVFCTDIKQTLSPAMLSLQCQNYATGLGTTDWGFVREASLATVQAKLQECDYVEMKGKWACGYCITNTITHVRQCHLIHDLYVFSEDHNEALAKTKCVDKAGNQYLDIIRGLGADQTMAVSAARLMP